MRKRAVIKVGAVVGLIFVFGIGWAVATPRVPHELQPPLEVPLYEGAQVEWDVQLSAQEMLQGLAEWAQKLSVLRIAGYQLEGERVLETVNFYDQALSDWRRIVWVKPTESGAMRLFAKGQSYLFVGISRGYETTEVVLATAQADKTPLDAPVVEGSQLHWELVLTSQDLLEHLKRWFVDLIENPPAAMKMSLWGQPERPGDSLLEVMSWLGVLGIEMLSRLFADFSELRIVGSLVDSIPPLQVLDFYEAQFSEWRRNFWIKPQESGSIRIFTKSDAQGLQELIALIVMPRDGIEHTGVIVLRAHR